LDRNDRTFASSIGLGFHRVNTCIFCGPTTEQLTGEHIYSEWITEKLRKVGITFAIYETNSQQPRAQTPGGHGLYTRKIRGLHVKHPVVCAPCNNEWLSTVEQKYLSPFFFDLIQGKSDVRLNSDEQVILAFWLVRLAMVIEFRGKKSTSTLTFFTQSERESFRNDELLVPEQTWIWIGRHVGETRFTEWNAFVGTHPLFRRANNDLADGIYVVNGKIGRFAFQLCSWRFLSLDRSPYAIRRAVQEAARPWRKESVQLWPHCDDDSVWHAPRNLRDSRLEKFFDRFGGRTLLGFPSLRQKST
jgi:hypothetical protein